MDQCQCGNPKKTMAKLCVTCRNVQIKIDIKRRADNKREMIRAQAKELYKTKKALICRRCDERCKPEEIDKGICHECKKK